jgi:hypothetical protein
MHVANLALSTSGQIVCKGEITQPSGNLLQHFLGRENGFPLRPNRIAFYGGPCERVDIETSWFRNSGQPSPAPCPASPRLAGADMCLLTLMTSLGLRAWGGQDQGAEVTARGIWAVAAEAGWPLVSPFDRSQRMLGPKAPLRSFRELATGSLSARLETRAMIGGFEMFSQRAAPP